MAGLTGIEEIEKFFVDETKAQYYVRYQIAVSHDEKYNVFWPKDRK